jgi:hypothetical protein
VTVRTRPGAFLPAATATPTPGGTVGVSSQWTFGTALLWTLVGALVVYALFRRFG